MSERVTVCSGWECVIVCGVGFWPDLVHSVRLDSVMKYMPCTCSTLLQVFSTQKAHAFI